MLLRVSMHTKGAIERRYFSAVEHKRVSGGRVLQRYMLYLDGDQVFAGTGVAPRAALVRVEHRDDKWTLKLDEWK